MWSRSLACLQRPWKASFELIASLPWQCLRGFRRSPAGGGGVRAWRRRSIQEGKPLPRVVMAMGGISPAGGPGGSRKVLSPL